MGRFSKQSSPKKLMRIVSPSPHQSRSSDGDDNDLVIICLTSSRRGARDAKHYAEVDPEAPPARTDLLCCDTVSPRDGW
jgi:hypothetical protein